MENKGSLRAASCMLSARFQYAHDLPGAWSGLRDLLPSVTGFLKFTASCKTMTSCNIHFHMTIGEVHHHVNGDAEAARPFFLEAESLATRMKVSNNHHTRTARYNLAWSTWSMGRRKLAIAMEDLGRQVEAADVQEQALKLFPNWLKPDEIASSMKSLFVLHPPLGQCDFVEPPPPPHLSHKKSTSVTSWESVLEDIANNFTRRPPPEAWVWAGAWAWALPPALTAHEIHGNDHAAFTVVVKGAGQWPLKTYPALSTVIGEFLSTGSGLPPSPPFFSAFSKCADVASF
jgi:hypothetical protein